LGKDKKFDLSDLIILLGGISISVGLYMIYPPLMFLFAGSSLIWVGLPGKVVKK
jgi:hypothetical protein